MTREREKENKVGDGFDPDRLALVLLVPTESPLAARQTPLRYIVATYTMHTSHIRAIFPDAKS